MGEHVHFKISLSQSDAFPTLTYWTLHSKRGEIKRHHCADVPCSADVTHFQTFIFSVDYGFNLNLSNQADSQSILRQGVDTKQVFYVLDPDANLGNSQDQFKEWFSR